MIPRRDYWQRSQGVLYAHDVNLHTAQVFTRDASVRIASTAYGPVPRRHCGLRAADVQQSLRDVLTLASRVKTWVCAD